MLFQASGHVTNVSLYTEKEKFNYAQDNSYTYALPWM